MVLLAYGTSRATENGKPLVLVFLIHHGRQRWGQKRGVQWRQRGRRLHVATTPAAARASDSELAAAISVSEVLNVGDGRCKGICVRASVSEGVGVGDERGGSVTCVVGVRGGGVTCVVDGRGVTVTCVVGSSKGLFLLPCHSYNKISCPFTWTFLSNCSGDDAFGRGVVCFYWGWWLGKTKFMECNY